VVTGGVCQAESESLVGSLAAASLRSAGFSKAFLGASGFSPSTGFTLNDPERAEISRVILERGAQNFVLTDSSKFGSVHAFSFCTELSRLKAVVTDEGISAEAGAALRKAGVEIIL
jgi:DeoR/GlpR family transcriptional regulator of sugar metabolism